MLPKTNREAPGMKAHRNRGNLGVPKSKARASLLAKAPAGMRRMRRRKRNMQGRVLLTTLAEAARSMLSYITRRAAHFFR